MKIRPLPADESAVRRFVEESWIQYHRDLAGAVESHDLADAIEDVEKNVEWWVDQIEPESYRAWVAVEGADGAVEDADTDAAAPLADAGGEIVGFITTDIDEAPDVFERPDRLIVGDFYVHADYRGTGLARELLDRAAERAREAGCGHVELNVDVDNDRALAFYEKCGFEPRRYRMSVDAEKL